MGKEQVIKKYIKGKRKTVCKLADKILQEMEKQIEGATLSQLSSMLGTILDRFGADEKLDTDEGLLYKMFDDFEEIV